MEPEFVLAKVQTIVKDILDNEDIIVSRDTVASDIDEWDSLAHIQLVVAMETEFGVRFTSREIQTWKNVGEIIDCIVGKQ